MPSESEILIRAATNGLALPKLAEITRRAGVSQTTASRVLRGLPVGVQARAAVLRAVGFTEEEIAAACEAA